MLVLGVSGLAGRCGVRCRDCRLKLCDGRVGQKRKSQDNQSPSLEQCPENQEEPPALVGFIKQGIFSQRAAAGRKVTGVLQFGVQRWSGWKITGISSGFGVSECRL